VPINQAYAEQQLQRYQQGLVPTDQWHESCGTQKCEYGFSELGRKLMAIEPWEI
jgi:hypothetical protein